MLSFARMSILPVWEIPGVKILFNLYFYDR